MRCEEYRAEFLAGETRPELDAHLRACETCRGDAPALERLREMLGERALWEEPSSELGRRVVGAVDARRTDPAPVRRWWPGAVAAVLVLVVGLGAWWWTASRPSPPDWEVTLVGTERAPGATGVVHGWETPHGTAVWLEVRGLDRAPDGHFYELWFVGERGLVSAGTFRAAPGFELWAAARLDEYPRLGITLEPENGDPARNGVQVMGSRAES